MKTLKDIINLYGGQLSDLEIIEKYFIDNNLELDGIELMRNLAINQASRLNTELLTIKGNINMFMPMHHNQGWSPDLQTAMEFATLRMMTNQEIPISCLDYLEKEIPNHKLPKFMWQDLYKKLKELGIIFKDDKNEKS